jgi:hypothetical protein
MGITKGHQNTYSISKVDSGKLITIVNGILKKRQHDNSTFSRRTPMINIDCSWIIRKHNGNVENRIGYLLRLTIALSSSGFAVCIVCDGRLRHHSKPKTLQCHADICKKKIELIVLKSKLNELITKRKDTDSITVQEEIDKEIAIHQKRAKTLENSVQKKLLM